MAITKSLRPIILKMQEDIKFKRLKETFSTLALYQIPIEELTKEVETLHKMREIRRLNTQDPAFVDQLIKANTNDQSIRGRLTEIMMTCIRASSRLQTAVDALKHHLLLTHGETLKSFRTKEERGYIVNMALVSFTRYLDNVSSLKECTQLIIGDIDKGSWSIRTSIDGLKMHMDRERHI